MSPFPDFTVTPAQQRFLAYIQANPNFQTIAEICQTLDLDPSTYYKWCHNPQFRLWLIQEWAAALFFDGWHILNVCRANMSRSPFQFKALFNIVFEPKGHAAFAAWQEIAAQEPPAQPTAGLGPVPSLEQRSAGLGPWGPQAEAQPPSVVTAGRPISGTPAAPGRSQVDRSPGGGLGPAPIKVETISESNQPLTPNISTFEKHQPQPQQFSPTKVARHLVQALKFAAMPAAPHPNGGTT